MKQKRQITAECLKMKLRKLVCIFGGTPVEVDLSIEDLLDLLRVLAVYRRFDLGATKRELCTKGKGKQTW